MKFKITHIEGSRKGATETFDAPVLTVGRDPSNVLVFDPIKDDRVSTRHAQLAEVSGQVVVTDLGSRNGTFVNGQRVQGSMPAPSGALVQFGEQGPQVIVHYEGGGAASKAPAKAGGGGGAGKGCMIALVVLLLLGVCGVASFFGWRAFHGSHGGG